MDSAALFRTGTTITAPLTDDAWTELIGRLEEARHLSFGPSRRPWRSFGVVER